ncbi:Rieske 2Fe-2S domain-containing protein [Flavobacterium sp.]|uniref:Rieske 2Fe-2S domain-containing protein n=1 Tax=Flavobacterium sp. TaxID=239 RepID=UPI00379BF87A
MTRKEFFSKAGYGAAVVLLPSCIAGLSTSCTIPNPNAPTTGGLPILKTNAGSVTVDGRVGGTSTDTITLNDTINGVPVVIGTGAGQVFITSITVPTGMTLNTNGTVTVAANTAVGSYNITYKITEVTNPTNSATGTSVVVVSASLPVILAVTETTAAINGVTGGTSIALTANDTLNGVPVVIGTAAGQVKLTAVTSPLPTGLTLNLTTGTVTVAPNTVAGAYNIAYKITEVTNPTNSATATSTIIVTVAGSLPVINAVSETTASINGTTGGTTTSLITNDTLNGIAVVIGTGAGQVKLTAVTVPAGLTLNANGTVTVAANTAAGNYNVTYKITEITNPTNSSTATSIIPVTVTPTATALATVDVSTGALATNGGFVVINKIVIARTVTGTFLAVAAACTHQGTNVKYVLANNNFHCPNHGAEFSSTGVVTKGPATTNLTLYKTVLTGTSLSVYP